MRATCLSALLASLLLLAVSVNAQVNAPEIRVISPGVVYNAGLLGLAAAFTKETGTHVRVTSSGMGRIVNDIKTVTPAPDVIMPPFELMSTLSLDRGVKPGTFTPLGRAEMGLAVSHRSWHRSRSREPVRGRSARRTDVHCLRQCTEWRVLRSPASRARWSRQHSIPPVPMTPMRTRRSLGVTSFSRSSPCEHSSPCHRTRRSRLDEGRRWHCRRTDDISCLSA